MPNRYPKRSQYKYTKKPYRLRNWPAYESALRKRGDLTLWFSPDAIQAWHVSKFIAAPNLGPNRTGASGGSSMWSLTPIRAISWPRR
jgi:hypothetical protein